MIKYSDILEAQRYDAEYFKPEYLKIEEKLEKCPSLQEVAFSVVCGPFGSTILDSTYTESGVEVVRPFNIKNYSIEEENLVYILEKDVKDKNLKIFESGDLFFARVGDIRTGIFTRQRATISPNIIAVKIDKSKQNPYFLSIFFNTKFGFSQLLRQQKIVAQPTISTGTVRNLRFPILLKSFQEEIEDKAKEAYKKQDSSKQLYREAEELLLTELGLMGYKAKKVLAFETTKKEIDEAGRYDSEYFQPKYEEIIGKVEKYKGGWDIVKNQFKQNIALSKKDTDYCNYIEIGDINVSNGEIIPTRREANEIPANGKRKLFKNDLLISKVRPYRGAISFIDFDMDNLLGSGAFTVLQEKTDYKKEVLMVFLKTAHIKELLLRYNCGTSYPVIKDEDILNLKIPLIKSDIQKQIAAKIQESHKLRRESKELLEEAKRKVEEEIEKEWKKSSEV